MALSTLYNLGTSSDSSDYIGFTYNGIPSSSFGIKRTSDGSRFNENLLPSVQDETIQVPGGDGTYYFGSYYTQKPFNVSFAFDSMTEQQLQEFKNWLGDKGVHDLIFDENPYKVYRAKVTGTATIKYIPFAEGETNRIYKGEGTIQFTCFDPYARSVKKYLNEYSSLNKDEWKGAANLLDEQGNFDRIVDSNKINLYNPGVRETDFILSFAFDTNSLIPAGSISIDSKSQLYFQQIKRKGTDTCVKINTKLNLIEGYVNDKKSGNIYNECVFKGTFFKIPITTEKDFPLQLVISNENQLANYFMELQYDYIYF